MAARADGDRNIYLQDNMGKNTGAVIGRTLTDQSFIFDDGTAVIGAIINPNNNTGISFLSNEIINADLNLGEYILNAKGGQSLDFKHRGMNERPLGITELQHRYRGMPFKEVVGFSESEDLLPVYASARDFGNVAAGYVAGNVGLSWNDARLGFDALESWQRERITTERGPTQLAQWFGFQVGHRFWANRHPMQNAIKNSGFFK